ncbi:hypothetical protein SacglDRAFT_00903 [Saccharomonospora glauca K62]|uniref:Uncharacterized protein n=1 Tax=Saccharomonospora glauca K62 TaxID=928724 RepID=I1CYR7_9PSEU|nr:hypothetical protein SacglDRAFT_00903 [Saccharomonospora glauca K62]
MTRCRLRERATSTGYGRAGPVEGVPLIVTSFVLDYRDDEAGSALSVAASGFDTDTRRRGRTGATR